MSVKITDHTPMIGFDTKTRINIFLRMFMDEVEKHSDPITPKREGPLRQSTLKTVSGNQYIQRGTIKWLKEYAAAQEVGTTRGFQIRNYTTPGTGKNYALRGTQKAMMNVGFVLRKAGFIS